MLCPQPWHLPLFSNFSIQCIQFWISAVRYQFSIYTTKFNISHIIKGAPSLVKWYPLNVIAQMINLSVLQCLIDHLLFIALVNPVVLSLKIHHKFDHFLPHINPVSFLAAAKASNQVCPLLIWPLSACYPEAIQVILSQSCPDCIPSLLKSPTVNSNHVLNLMYHFFHLL